MLYLHQEMNHAEEMIFQTLKRWLGHGCADCLRPDGRFCSLRAVHVFLFHDARQHWLSVNHWCSGQEMFLRRNSSLGARIVVCLILLLAWKARSGSLIVNGGFESGSSSWSLQGSSVTSTGGYARSGSSYLEIFPAPYAGHQGFAYQTISIPANVTAATLSYYWNVSLVYSSVVADDILTVLVRDPVNFGVLENLKFISSASKSAPGNPNFRLAQHSLLAYAGRTVRIEFLTFNNPVSGNTVFRIDDVSVVTSTSPCGCSLSATSDNRTTPQQGSGSFTVFSSNSACYWTASSSAWIYTSARGVGTLPVNYTYDANTSSLARTGSISVLGSVFMITQPGLMPTPISMTPTNGAIGVSVTPTLNWSPVSGATHYRVLLSTSEAKLPWDSYATTCTNCTQDGFVGSTYIPSYSAPAPFPVDNGSTRVLKHSSRYYWKVQAWKGSGFAGVYSSVYSFTTAPIAQPVIRNPKLEGSTFSVTVATEVGVNYSLERKQFVTDSAWKSVDSGKGMGEDIILSDPSGTGITRVYRVVASE